MESLVKLSLQLPTTCAAQPAGIHAVTHSKIRNKVATAKKRGRAHDDDDDDDDRSGCQAPVDAALDVLKRVLKKDGAPLARVGAALQIAKLRATGSESALVAADSRESNALVRTALSTALGRLRRGE